MTPRAILFDFDGVLADTENVHVVAWERTFGVMGWDVPHEVCARAAEEDDRSFLEGLFTAKQIEDGDVEGWVRRKQGLTVQLLADAPRLYPGVGHLIAALESRATLAVVSTTWGENIRAVLGSAGLDRAFRVVVAKEDVRAVKPDPQAYQLALRRLKVRPSESIALEDSPVGLAAARAAGVPVVAVGHRRSQGEWTGGASFLPDLRDPEACLRLLGIG